jgi:acetolactate synthase-1/2/3 large subunit
MIGFDPVEFDREWTARARIVHVGVVPNDDRYYGSEVEIVGPIDVALERLCAAADPQPKLAGDEVRAFRDAFTTRVRPSSTLLTPQQVLAELRAAVPEDGLVTCDVGYNKAVSTQCWPSFQPRTFFLSNGLSSMGYGLPAALALKMAEPVRQVACVLGDGGFAMSMAELETGVRLGLGVRVVVLVDDALSQIRASQERKGYPVTGTTFGPLDYAKLGAAFGIEAKTVSTADECRDAFRNAPRDRPLLVAARIDPSAYRIG